MKFACVIFIKLLIFMHQQVSKKIVYNWRVNNDINEQQGGTIGGRTGLFD
jgi:hypothetical protein